MGGIRAQAARAHRSAPGAACYDRSTAAAVGGRTYAVSEKTVGVGDQAPDFTLKSIGLKEVSLHDYRGKNVVLLFYPLDWTPG